MPGHNFENDKELLAKTNLPHNFANSFNPDQAQQNLDPICLTLKWYSWKNFSKKLILNKSESAVAQW